MSGGRWRALLVVGALLLPGGCALLGVPTPPSAATPSVPPDGPIPSTLRAAVPSARAFLEDRWAAAGEPLEWFRFVEGRCAMGGAGALVFERFRDGLPLGFAIAGSHDIAAGIVSGAWWSAIAASDPLAHPEVRRILDGREVACP